MSSFLVTGASKGIGRALVRQLVHSGHRVWAVARSAALLKSLDEELNSVLFHFSIVDVGNPQNWVDLKKEMAKKHFTAETLFLNAGVYSDDADENDLTNYDGVVNAWETYGGDIRERGGAIAVTGSVFAFIQPAFKYSYAMSKYKAWQFIRNLSENRDNKNVNFKYYALGPVDSGIKSGAGWKSALAPSAAKTARFMIGSLEKGNLIQIFPFSSKLLLAISKLLPASWMSRLLSFFKR